MTHDDPNLEDHDPTPPRGFVKGDRVEMENRLDSFEREIRAYMAETAIVRADFYAQRMKPLERSVDRLTFVCYATTGVAVVAVVLAIVESFRS